MENASKHHKTLVEEYLALTAATIAAAILATGAAFMIEYNTPAFDCRVHTTSQM